MKHSLAMGLLHLAGFVRPFKLPLGPGRDICNFWKTFKMLPLSNYRIGLKGFMNTN